MNFWERYSGEFIPPGYMTVPDVFEVIGRTIYNADHWREKRWTGREAGYDLPLSEEEAERRLTTFRWMHRRASAGVLTFHTFKDGRIGAVHPGFWNCTEADAIHRFQMCAIHLNPRAFPIVVGTDVTLSLDIIVDHASLLRTVESTSVGPDYGRDANSTVELFLEQVEARKMNASAEAGSPQPVAKPMRRAGPAPDESRVRELAAVFDDEGTPKRRVRASLISERWNPDWGTVPKKEDVWSFMKGGNKGAPARK